MGGNPSYYDGANRPVEQASWNDIQRFEEELDDAFRLPSESEWEYACRAETDTRFYWGNDPDYTEINEYAWYDGNSNGQTHDVGQKHPNAWGLHDIAGNVWEWCEDWYHSDDYNNAPDDGSAWEGGGKWRIRRGGSFNDHDPASYCRSANRSYDLPEDGGSESGFRLVHDAD